MPGPQIHAADDPKGQRIGMLTAILAMVLAIVSISGHRTRAAAILHLTASNREWARYEVANLKYLSVELAGLDAAQAAATKQKYEQQATGFQESAERGTALAESDDRRSQRYDIGEGLLEIAVFLTSFYFLSRKNLFPAMGAAIGIIGILVALTGLAV